MNPLLGSVFLGRALAEGDYLGALPMIPDLFKAVKASLPNLLREKAGQELVRLQNKVGGAAPASSVVDTPAYPVQPAPQHSWIIPAVVVGGAVAFLYFRKKRRK